MAPTERDWEQLFDELAEQPLQLALVCTGGGSGAVSRCFRRAGASKNFVEATIPYSRQASAAYLGRTPPASRASVAFAEALAEVAKGRASQWSDRQPAIAAGVALTAALPTAGAAGDQLRIHVAVHSPDFQQSWSTTWNGHPHTRESAEDLADAMVYQALRSLLQSIPS